MNVLARLLAISRCELAHRILTTLMQLFAFLFCRRTACLHGATTSARTTSGSAYCGCVVGGHNHLDKAKVIAVLQGPTCRICLHDDCGLRGQGLTVPPASFQTALTCSWAALNATQLCLAVPLCCRAAGVQEDAHHCCDSHSNSRRAGRHHQDAGHHTQCSGTQGGPIRAEQFTEWGQYWTSSTAAALSLAPHPCHRHLSCLAAAGVIATSLIMP